MRSRFFQFLNQCYTTLRYRLSFKQYLFLAFLLSIIVFIVPGYFEPVRVVYPSNKVYDQGALLAADGNTVIVGHPHRSNGKGGYVDVYVKSHDQWIKQAKLIPSDYGLNPKNPSELTYHFGETLGISKDTIAVMNRQRGEQKGSHVYIFARQGTTWKEQAKLVLPTSTPDPRLLSPVAIAIDGDTIVVRTIDSAVVYDREPKTLTWHMTQTLKLHQKRISNAAIIPPRNLIAIEGNRFIVDSGKRYIFERAAATSPWVLSSKISTCGRIAFSGDTIVTGCPDDGSWGGSSAAFGSTGVAYVYERDPRTGNWRKTARLRPRGANIGISVLFQSNYAFGAAVAVNGDNLLVSAHNIGQYNKSKETAVYYYHRDPKTRKWSQKAKILSDPVESLPRGWEPSGKGVALTQETAVIGEGSVPLPKPRYASSAFYSFPLKELNSSK
jgi:hypothetical protein